MEIFSITFNEYLLQNMSKSKIQIFFQILRSIHPFCQFPVLNNIENDISREISKIDIFKQNMCQSRFEQLSESLRIIFTSTKLNFVSTSFRSYCFIQFQLTFNEYSYQNIAKAKIQTVLQILIYFSILLISSFG